MLLEGFSRAYNARRQRVLEGRSPDEVVRERLEAAPKLVNSRSESLFECAFAPDPHLISW